MPRCYMVKKALCNKYMSVTRGFESWNRSRDSPSPHATLITDSPKVSLTPIDSLGMFDQIFISKILFMLYNFFIRLLIFTDSNTSQLRNVVFDRKIYSVSTSNSISYSSLKSEKDSSVLDCEKADHGGSDIISTATSSLVTTNSRYQNPIISSSSKTQDAEETPIFRDRSAAETEAAHDLLELSRSLPPLPPPSIAIGPQNVIESPTTENVQEISIYQPVEPPIYQVNTIDLTGSTATVYQQQATGIIYEPTIVQQTSNGVFIPLSPVQEILFTYTTPTIPSIIATQVSPLEAPPLTPPTSECSSDIENNNPNLQPSQRDKEVQTITEQTEVKTASYTYDTLLVADGRSKNKKQISNIIQKNNSVTEITVEPPEAPRAGRYVCCECGMHH